MKRKENLEKRRKFYILVILLMVLLITSFIAVVKLSNGEFKPGILNFNSAEEKEEEKNTNSVEQETEKIEESDSKEATTDLMSSLTFSKTGIFSLSNISNKQTNQIALGSTIADSAVTIPAGGLEMESIVQGVRDINIPDGDYNIIVNGKTYPVEVKNYYDDMNYTSTGTNYLGNSTADARMLIVKYHGNLTINSGVVLTPTTRKKGMFICVLGKTVNNGEITMTARGSTASGENVYLYKNKNGSYEYIPAIGASGLSAHNVGTNSKGIKGNDGTNRASGSGGQGAGCSDAKSGSNNSKIGASSSGTSYAGGSGSGALIRYNLSALAASKTQANDTTGGNGTSSDASDNVSLFAGAGAGVIGGKSGYKNRSATDTDQYAENGAGGLLILYTDVLENKGTISSKGSNGAGAWCKFSSSYSGARQARGGGGSGGGSVNVFYNYMTFSGQYTASGGKGGDITGCTNCDWKVGASGNGGDGGNGSVTLTNLKQYGLTKANTYIRKKETLTLHIENKIEPDEIINNNQFIWTSSNPDVATVNSNGKVTGKAIGRTTITAYNGDKIKVKAIINVYNNDPKAIAIPQAEEGTNFSVVLKEDGTVWTTGRNNYGQLGIGTSADVNVPSQVKIDENEYLKNIKKISVAANHVLALSKDGEVYVWGYNGNGQLGQGGTSNLYYATRMKGIGGSGYVSNAIDIAAGSSTSYVLLNNGYIYGTGYGGYYQITGYDSSYYYLTKVSDNTSMITWEYSATYMNNVIAITAGSYNVGCITADGKTLVRGYNGYGALGTGNTSTVTTSYYLGNDINQIWLGGNSGAIIKEDGTVWTAGDNGNYKLGLGDTGNHYTYTKVKFKETEDEEGNTVIGEDVKAKYVTISYQNLVIHGKDNKIYVAGYNNYKQVLNGTTSSNTHPGTMKDDSNKEIEGILFASSGASASNIIVIKEDGTVWVSGYNYYGQVGNGTNTDVQHLTKMGDGFVNYPNKNIELDINETETIDKNLFKIEDDINVFVDGIALLNNITLRIEDSNIAELSNTGVVTGKAQGRTKIIVEDCSAGIKTYIWVKVTDGKRVDIDTGNKFTIALKQDGSVWTWGYNNYGQLGLGNKTTYKEPQKVTGITERIKDIAAGNNHALALTENGEVYAWGYNNYGQIGDNTKTNRLSPVKLGGGN